MNLYDYREILPPLAALLAGVGLAMMLWPIKPFKPDPPAPG